MIVKPGLGVTTPVKITGAEEENGLPVFHPSLMSAFAKKNNFGNVKGLARSAFQASAHTGQASGLRTENFAENAEEKGEIHRFREDQLFSSLGDSSF